MGIVRKIIKGPIEHIGAKVIGEIFWPAPSVAVLAEGQHDDFLVLDADAHYELPGGLLKRGEDLRDAAKREFKEETGFKVDLGDLMDVRTSRNGVHFFFHGEVKDGEKDGGWEGYPEFIDREEMSDKAWRLEHSHIHEYLFPEE
ncbi:MAG: NUDIX hydrolase [Candidatus Nanohaloarchaea archaeon]